MIVTKERLVSASTLLVNGGSYTSCLSYLYIPTAAFYLACRKATVDAQSPLEMVIMLAGTTRDAGACSHTFAVVISSMVL